jgi:hypothetical protein
VRSSNTPNRSRISIVVWVVGLGADDEKSLIREHYGNRRCLAFAALAAGTLLGMSPLFGASSALAAACATASVSVYEAAGFSCNVGPVTFSDITVGSTTSGSGVVVLNDFSPFSTVVDGVTEFGLHLRGRHGHDIRQLG